MFNASWSEMLIVGAVALIVIGPKDLPKMLRQLGRFVGQARGMAQQFQRSMTEAANAADMDEFTKVRDFAEDWKKGTQFKSMKNSLTEHVGLDPEVEEWTAAKTEPAKPAPATVAADTPAPDAAAKADASADAKSA